MGGIAVLKKQRPEDPPLTWIRGGSSGQRSTTSVISEVQPQRELENAWIQCTGYLAEVTKRSPISFPACKPRGNRTKVRVIPDIKEFRTELKLEPFSNREGLVQGPVPSVFPRPADQPCAAASKEAESRCVESTRVKPLRQRLWTGHASGTIGPRGQPGCPDTQPWSEGEAAFDYRDSRKRPAPQGFS